MARQATQDSVDLSVGSTADLTNLVDDLRVADGTRVWLTGAGATHGLWCLDQTSTATVDGLTVVATLSGAGRWIYHAYPVVSHRVDSRFLARRALAWSAC